MTTEQPRRKRKSTVAYTGRINYMVSDKLKTFLERKAIARQQQLSEYLRNRESRILEAEKDLGRPIN